ncbi:hypothetical protein P154DRAFT_519419 [Amniculicola lignicola CBS 123094]|uniref:Heat shock factor binding protein 1 n=1 Tax=Amniculicola lignicola CBS 123094 TaxID=1392246 RepID=A0A6A5WVK6_9PLEO|nr:hypothetical protein P154DRAFT_519419 [Amniculicola lignicola CBS 123094]
MKTLQRTEPPQVQRDHLYVTWGIHRQNPALDSIQNTTSSAMSSRPVNDRSGSDGATLNSTSDSSTAELTAVVDDLLNQLNTKFSSISSELLTKMDDMSRRLDNLEATIQGGEGGKGTGK